LVAHLADYDTVLGDLVFQGLSEPTYAARSIMSRRERPATIGFIKVAVVPSRVPDWNAYS
jgi:hypothetical protein